MDGGQRYKCCLCGERRYTSAGLVLHLVMGHGWPERAARAELERVGGFLAGHVRIVKPDERREDEAGAL